MGGMIAQARDRYLLNGLRGGDESVNGRPGRLRWLA